jgi:uncharacterized damage-inducible protein DinB
LGVPEQSPKTFVAGVRHLNRTRLNMPATTASPTAAVAAPATSDTFITPAAMLAHWQGHRRLTRRMIEAFPEDKLFAFSIGGMRPFGELATEMLGMAEPTVRGVVTGQWKEFAIGKAATKAELLRQWDESTRQIDELFPRIPADHFKDTVTAFGQYTMPVHEILLYTIDNEIHHRGQGYVYLRALGIEPPPFYVRS